MNSKEIALEKVSFTLVITAKQNNPTILNPDFLKYNNIVPPKWKLKNKPMCIEPYSRVSYDNNILIVSEPERIHFNESIRNKELDDFEIPQIAIKYTESVPHVRYEAIGINFVHQIKFQSSEEPQKYFIDNFLKDTSWLSDDDNKVAIKKFEFSVLFDESLLSILIEPTISIVKEIEIPVIQISSNFHLDIVSESVDERLLFIKESINNWRNRISEIENLLNDKFR
jgi:hypothetical protein